MDDLDSRLIAELRRDGRASLSDLAHALGVTRTTVRARLRRLIERGEVAGFTVLTRADVAQAPVRGLMMLAIEGRWTDRVMARLGGIPEVGAFHTTNGPWDLIVEVSAESLEAFDEALFAIRRIEGVARSETHLLLSSRRPLRRGV
ncbi:Lrp/AsnC family transcriptional regulator [Rubellimicrobium sp. CFH 75288]|uniref:Lrp/AsnC family transcriptional regulator n=1 Tax=Rubellimicrobium sp. CFH 75288 TaxID=2697034 RepID=UPI0014134FBD|nr:Lrp/AsnC family transcriptional regulator [Rubellimicrobium sp. CFH 75288]NAZ36944.1 AsnC family transcriptional regulator [Rubellimicrobium sp. CFH 75288]